MLQNYNEAVKDGKKTIVFSTSITKVINVKHFNVNYNNGTAKFVCFHAATASLLIKHYATPTLRIDQPETVIIMCGGNDLPTSRENPTSVESIAETIIQIGELYSFMV